MNDQEVFVAPPVFEETTPRHRLWPWLLMLGVVVLFLACGVMWWRAMSHPPSAFPVEKLIVIPSGASLDEIAVFLKEERVIRSEIAFVALVRFQGTQSRVMAGDYLFSSPLDLEGVARRLTGGEHGIGRLRVTIPEGTSVAGMGRIFKGTLAQFDEAQFLALAQESEGYLFPDTYFFFSNATSGPIFESLRETFRGKTDALYREALATGKNWSDIIIMASIIEEETATPKDRRVVSGILSKRMERGMPLGVDAPFAYAIGKNSSSLTTEDLQTDSPYNTYRYLGLPPTPITNPGLDSIDAAIHPESSPYYYYLSDKDGTIHYAKTFEEHKRNKEKYLR